MGARDWFQVYKVVICTVNARGKVGFSHYKKPTLCTYGAKVGDFRDK